ncbi:hypothetical protein F4827_005271 [Paraburkholderia bannensis]|uniref:Uncharacterized protein n=1 Tax=Paraburkholderia bannensis TaxID=765414 RepID=A0A7W9WV74_9BURK|nr:MULTISPECIES: hypothetical protein [Paraburkholderia]MBB3260368.1 hypothetical protein [Paraburkholderia sp. WP4_3_2]MBB6105404.1 hypothetical protein [Paraburkholderia bannensis]
MTYLSVTRATGQQPAQDELLNLFSAKYYNEQDTFKKHDLIATEWPPIEASLKPYAGQNYYALPFGGSTNLNVHEALPITIGSFANMNYSNQQNVVSVIAEDTGQFEQIEDEALARQIEQLRTSGMLSLRGLAYLRVDKVQNGNQVHVTLQHLHVDVYETNRRTSTAEGNWSRRSICSRHTNDPKLVHGPEREAVDKPYPK